MERAFCTTGGKLEDAIGLLDELTTHFNHLVHELDNDALRRTAGDLRDAARRLSQQASAQEDVWNDLEALRALIGTIGGRVTRMHQAIRAVDVLAVNARIEAAHIIGAGDEFVTFAGKIGRSLELARINLDRFQEQLAAVAAILSDAQAGEQELARYRAAAGQAVPDRLAKSISAVEAAHDRAAAAARLVREKAGEIGARVGQAVMALQIGDTTRQRLEHVHDALVALDPLLAAADHGAALFGCGLQAAQLRDAAAELARETSAIGETLGGMAGDAREIVGLGRQAFAADGANSGSFMLQLQKHLAEAEDLTENLCRAQVNASQIVIAVGEAMGNLVRDLKVIQSLEADTRIMALNTTLKCARVGGQGRSLAAIAQELRGCSDLTQVEAVAIAKDLQALRAAVESLGRGAHDRAAREVTAVTAIIRTAHSSFDAIGQALAGALVALVEKGDVVADLLNETVADVSGQKAMLATIRDVAAELEDLAAGRDGMAPDPQRIDYLFDDIGRRYTMAREREVHGAFRAEMGLAAGPAIEAPDAAEQDLEDIFF